MKPFCTGNSKNILSPVIRFVLLLIVLAFQPLMAQDCDECSHPRIGLFDFLVSAADADQDTSAAGYLDCYWPAAFARGYLREENLQNSCVTFYDGGMLNALDRQDGTLRYGQKYTNLPPAGEVNNADYIITGEVSGSGGNYNVKISLQAAVSREEVASGYASFTSSDPNGAPNAGRAAAKQISPLLQKIKDFEKRKRDTDTEVAIRDYWNKNSTADITVTPAKRDANTNEEISVEITMIDCDGVPLKNRKITLTGANIDGTVYSPPTGGHFSESSVVTDAEGKAKAKFITADKKGLAVLNVYYLHKKPNGRSAAFMGTSIINVKEEPSRFFLLNAVITRHVTYRRDTTASSSIVGFNLKKEYSDFSDESYNVHFKAILENESPYPGYFAFNSGIAPVSVTGSGSGKSFYMSKDMETTNGMITGADFRTTYTGGPALVNSPLIEIWLDSTMDFISLGAGFRRIGKYEGRMWGTVPGGGPGWVLYDGKYDDTTGYVDPEIDSEPGIYVTKTDGGYSFHWTQNENTTQNTYYGTAFETVEQTLDGTLMPYKITTGVDMENVSFIPGKYYLEQNYPNPFNPSTMIRFSLPAKSFVSLKIYDILGNEMASIVEKEMPAGMHEEQLIASNFPSGIYFCRLSAGGVNLTRKLLLIK